MTAAPGGAAVTVCIPSYRSAGFIGQTLASVAAQTYGNFKVLMAIEPEDAQATVLAMSDFLADPRFDYYVNTTNHGYALNVRGLLPRVRTPYFAVLPHDDLWHPDFLATLVGRLADRPEASGAYGDTYKFGHYAGYRAVAIADGPLFERLLSFYTEGAEGQPWHGVTRRELLDQPYPYNEFDGFAVECEWALHLVLRGPVLHDENALYLKRESPDGSAAVSVGWRVRMAEGTLRAALAHHRRRMLAPLDALPLSGGQRRLMKLAAEAAMLRRWMMFSKGRFDLGHDDEGRLWATRGGLLADGSAEARAIHARLLVAISRHAMNRGDRAAGIEHAEAAVALQPDLGDAFLHLANVYLVTGRVDDALEPVRRASELLPAGSGVVPLQVDAARAIAQVNRVAS